MVIDKYNRVFGTEHRHWASVPRDELIRNLTIMIVRAERAEALLSVGAQQPESALQPINETPGVFRG